MYLGAGRALLLQLAHPKIAQGVVEHSDFTRHGLRRLARTVDFIAAVSFASPEVAEHVAARVRRAHAVVTGPGYSAEDPELQVWVTATIVDTALHCLAVTCGPVPPETAARYYAQATAFSQILGCPHDAHPEDYPAFRAYVGGMLATLTVTPEARQAAQQILNGTGMPTLWRPAVPVFRFVTIGLLPDPIREQYRLPWSPLQAQLLDTALRSGGTLSALLPARVRRCIPDLYQGARRINAAVDALTREV